MPEEMRAATFFDKFAGSFDTLYDGKRNAFMRWVDRRWRRDMFIRYALTFETLDPLADKTVLDIGCGSGPYIVEALKRGARRVTGMDPAPGMLSLARQRLETESMSDSVELVESYFPGAELEPHDYAMVMGVLDYIEDPGAFLAALKPLVRERAVVSFPSRHWFRTPFRRFRYRLRDCPVYFFDPARIEALARDAGFASVEIRKIPGAGMDYHVCLAP
jgi:2-polyprenyl-3-methyl-5-hydroxy-6-metoxy-1,4-benzoquinol methylase